MDEGAAEIPKKGKPPLFGVVRFDDVHPKTSILAPKVHVCVALSEKRKDLEAAL